MLLIKKKQHGVQKVMLPEEYLHRCYFPAVLII